MTKPELIEEIISLKQRIDELEQSETQHRHTEEALRRSEAKFKEIFETIEDLYYETDSAGIVKLVSPSLHRLTGWDEEDVLGEPTTKFYADPDDRERMLLKLSEKGYVHDYEILLKRKDGKERQASLSARLIIDDNGQPVGLRGLLRDITARKQIEETLKESEGKFRDLTEKSVAGVYLLQDGLLQYVNLRFAQILGYTIEEMIGKVTAEDVIFPEDWPIVEENLHKRLSGELESLHYEFRIRTKDQQVKNAEVYSSRTAYQGKPAVIGTLLDITERKRMEDVLRNSEERFHMLFESAGDAIVITKGVIVDCNEKTLSMFGCTRDELLGKNLHSYSPAFQLNGRNSIDEALNKIRSSLNGIPQFFEWKHCRADGEPFDAEVSLTRIDIHGETYLQAIVRDVTNRKQTEEELRRLSIAIEQAAEEVIITDPEGVIQYVNPAFEKITGYSRREAMGKTPRIIKSGVHDKTFYDNLWDTIKNGNIWTGQITNKRKDGTLIQESATISPFINSSGQLTGYVSLKRDITEEVKLHSQLVQAQKMEAIGTLAGGIAHDFNNLLTVIMGFGALLQMKMKESDPLRNYIDQILSSSQKAANLTRSILAFSRKQPITLAPVSMNDCIKGTEKLLKRLLIEDIELSISLTPEDVIIMADATQIDQILFNLATNARDAMKNGGKLTIGTKPFEMDDKFKELHGFGEPGKYVLLSVSDTGCGMDEITREKIFDPFFTTKDLGEGTGLGLSTVYGIVKQHNGYIVVSSKPDKGTIFSVYLPAIEAVVKEEKTLSSTIKGGNESILIAEDDAGVRLFMKEILASHGYTVIQATDGQDAINKFKVCDNIDLMIIDSVMPIKNGREAHDEIQKIKPLVKTLFMSGYTKDIVLDKGVEEGKVDFIAKPILPAELLKKVREVLDK